VKFLPSAVHFVSAGALALALVPTLFVGCVSAPKNVSAPYDPQVRSANLPEGVRIEATPLVPATVQLLTLAELEPNRILLASERTQRVNRRLAAWASSRTCFLLRASKDGKDVAIEPRTWSGEAIIGEKTTPLILSRYEGIACTEETIDLAKSIVLRFQTQFIETASNGQARGTLASFAWNAKTSELDSIPVGSGSSLEFLPADPEHPHRVQIVQNALRSGRLARLKADLPETGIIYARSDFTAFGEIAAQIASQGGDCYEDMIKHLLSLGAELSPNVFRSARASEYERMQAYTCPLFAREMYRWVPAERERILASLSNQCQNGRIPSCLVRAALSESQPSSSAQRK
jgi:hypothetical protein